MSDDLQAWARKKRKEAEEETESKEYSYNVAGIVGSVTALFVIGGASYFLFMKTSEPSGKRGRIPYDEDSYSEDESPSPRVRKSRKKQKSNKHKEDVKTFDEDAYMLVKELKPMDD